MEAPITSMEGSINLHEQKKKYQENIFKAMGMTYCCWVYSSVIPIDFKIRQTC